MVSLYKINFSNYYLKFIKSIIFYLFTASQIGLDTVHHQVLSGIDMDQMNDLQLEAVINNVSIFYRVTPKHKLTIVKVCII